MQVRESTEDDAMRLMKQWLHHHKTTNNMWIGQIKNYPNTIFLYTQNQQKDAKNREKLVKVSYSNKVPIAQLYCQWQSNNLQGTKETRVYKSHFDTCQMVLEADLCVRATMKISGINIVPKIGLYNGARGTLIDFIYKDVCGPNNQHGPHLTEAVVVDCPGLNLGHAEP